MSNAHKPGDVINDTLETMALPIGTVVKNKFDDVLDPIGMAPDTFELNLASGAIKPERTLAARQGKPAAALARKTIRRLKLDSPEHRKMRLRHYNQYLRHKDPVTLQELSPFVWYEAQRQGLL